MRQSPLTTILLLAVFYCCISLLLIMHHGREALSSPIIERLSLGMKQGHTNYSYLSERAASQIENYRRGTGLIVNLHVTHHGGTTLCKTIGRSPDAIGRAPNASCNGEPGIKNITGYFMRNTPWTLEETSKMIPNIRRHFHMVGWEYGFSKTHLPRRPLHETDWENPDLISILIVRDPISRLLAKDDWIKHIIPNFASGNATREDWWTYANNTWYTNNYALRVLAGDGCCDGANTDRRHLEHAKALVDRMSIVLDIECLSEGIASVANLLNISVAQKSLLAKRPHRAPSRERIGHDDIYDFLVQKNKLDIELYEYARRRALIDCSAKQLHPNN